jgi:hypothetical protein
MNGDDFMLANFTGIQLLKHLQQHVDFLHDDHGLAREREEASLLLFIHRGTKPSRARGATDTVTREEPSLYAHHNHVSAKQQTSP